MKLIDVREARAHLSRLLDEALAGEEIVIAKKGRPQVRLVPWVPEQSPRVLGAAGRQAKGKVWIADDFDAPDSRITRMFGGDDALPFSKLASRLNTKRGR